MGVEELRKTKKNLMKTKNDIAKLEASVEEGKEVAISSPSCFSGPVYITLVLVIGSGEDSHF